MISYVAAKNQFWNRLENILKDNKSESVEPSLY